MPRGREHDAYEGGHHSTTVKHTLQIGVIKNYHVLLERCLQGYYILAILFRLDLSYNAKEKQKQKFYKRVLVEHFFSFYLLLVLLTSLFQFNLYCIVKLV